jgi:hypothetical protein
LARQIDVPRVAKGHAIGDAKADAVGAAKGVADMVVNPVAITHAVAVVNRLH